MTNPGLVTYNLGSGQGYSVLEMVKAFEQASGKTVAYQISPRREGDIAQCYAATDLAERELGWKAERNIVDMTADTWRWQLNNRAFSDLNQYFYQYTDLLPSLETSFKLIV